ncbi:hypothetical protein [Buchnera aphidicola]|uniref:hypothetical protein n=1 Tax=Buchnera aphidicola TaxID=9 RepID=UPI00346478EB
MKNIKLNLQVSTNIKNFIPKKKKIFHWIKSILKKKQKLQFVLLIYKKLKNLILYIVIKINQQIYYLFNIQICI